MIRMGSRILRTLLALLGLLAAARAVEAQPVLLQIRPRVGDTLNVRLTVSMPSLTVTVTVQAPKALGVGASSMEAFVAGLM